MAKAYYEEGRYVTQIVSQAMGKAKTGTPQFVLRFKVLGKPDPDDPASFIPDRNQYERTCYRAITEKTIEYFREDLKTLGFSGSSFRQLDPTSPGFHSFTGLQVDMFCKHEDDQTGGTREKWGIARQMGELKVDPLDSKTLRDLDNLLGKHLKEFAPAAKPVAVPATAAGVDDRDIPF